MILMQYEAGTNMVDTKFVTVTLRSGDSELTLEMRGKRSECLRKMSHEQLEQLFAFLDELKP